MLNLTCGDFSPQVSKIIYLIKKLNFEKKKLKYLKYITQAGGKLTEDISLDFVNICKKKKFKIKKCYTYK